MRIAAAYINGDIDPHFGRTSQLKVYEIEDGSVTAASLLETQGIGHGAPYKSAHMRRHRPESQKCSQCRRYSHSAGHHR